MDGSPVLVKGVHVLERYLCNYVHNPIVALAVCLGAFVALQVSLVGAAVSTSHTVHLRLNDYILDLLHHAVNLLFILRFVCGPNVAITSQPIAEWILFVIQNVGCMVFIFCPGYSLLYLNLHVVFKGFMVWQIMCPYLILAMNIAEGWSSTDDEKNGSTRSSLHALLVDSNNNFLPVFIAHSFAQINFNFIFMQGTWVSFLYKCACFSLKFFLIYRFILYELVVVIYNVPNVKTYAELYLPVQIGNPVRHWYHRVSAHTSTILVMTTVICMLVDAALAGLCLATHGQ